MMQTNTRSQYPPRHPAQRGGYRGQYQTPRKPAPVRPPQKKFSDFKDFNDWRLYYEMSGELGLLYRTQGSGKYEDFVRQVYANALEDNKPATNVIAQAEVQDDNELVMAPPDVKPFRRHIPLPDVNQRSAPSESDFLAWRRELEEDGTLQDYYSDFRVSDFDLGYERFVELMFRMNAVDARGHPLV